MLYILDQRLQAQSISADKGIKVREDMIRHLFAPQLTEELFKPQPLYSMAATRQIFDKLAHSSIMKLHTASMNKLFDLMLMGVKMQIMRTSEPSELLMLTLNHVTSLQEMIPGSPVQDQIHHTVNLLKERYSSMNPASLYRIKSSLLNFFQDRFVKVSLFLSQALQLPDGSFRLDSHIGCPKASVPGKVMKLSSNGNIFKESMFELCLSREFEPYNNQFSQLGVNLYSEKNKREHEETKTNPVKNTQDVCFGNRKEVAKWELNTLSDMISPSNDEKLEEFHFDLFANDEDTRIEEASVTEIVAASRNETMDKFIEDLEVNANRNDYKNEDNDLLDLL